MLTRNEKLLHDIDPANQSGVEIGALHTPIVTHEMGEIRYVDHDTTEAIRNKYSRYPSEHRIDLNKIVDVDYVWGERSLKELTKAEAPFDYVIASHVIEHVPDLIGWLSEIRAILKPGGILSLAIPDKRQCFDCQRQNTRLCEILEAYLHQNKKPSPWQIFDFYASEVTTVQGEHNWSGELAENTEFLHPQSLSKAWEITQEVFKSGNYHDVHCWVFTPTSFLILLADLAELELLKFEVSKFYNTSGSEFLISLRAVEKAVPRSSILEASIKTMEDDLQSLQQAHLSEKVELETLIKAMESSKFWQLRMAWFRMQRKLGFPV
jgi:SAM-dependent methyltransferase